MAKTASSKGPKNKAGTPLKWYAFYSEKAGREYYYEPTNRVTTWVLPDDAHPYSPQNGRIKEAPPTVERGGNFCEAFREKAVDSVTAHISRSVELGEEDDLNSAFSTHWLLKKKYAFALLFLAFLVAGVTLHRVIHSRQALLKIRKRKEKHTSSCPISDVHCLLGGNSETDSLAHGNPTAPLMTRKVTPSSFDSNDNYADSIMERSMMIQDRTDSLQTSRMPSGQGKDGRYKVPVSTRTGIESEEAKPDGCKDRISPPVRGRKQSKTSQNRGCRVPFAYLFSGTCRKLAAENPVFDLKGLVDFMIE